MAWMHYNPQRADPAFLDEMTGGASRLALLDELAGVLRSEPGRPNHQHQLLIGPRGSGKTHLLRVLVHRLRQDPTLESAWWPVVLPEEVAIRGPADLLAVVLDRLDKDLAAKGEAAARTAVLEARAVLKGMRRGVDSLEVADAALQKVSVALGRSLVVVVENLDGVLYLGPGGSHGKAGEEQWALRRLLQAAPHLLVVGAAPTHFGAASDAGAAFHGFFRQHLVEGLPTAEVLAILEHRLQKEAEGESERARRARDLQKCMPERRGKLAGILRLTGGLPRFVHLVVDLLLDSEDGEVGDLMDRLLDEQTPLFQSRLDPRLVAPQELEALAELARADGPLRPAELARRVKISGAEASVLLERLRERGLARRSGRSGNATTWDVGEPLYRVWMAFREGGEPRSRMEALAGVVAALWDQEDLEKKKGDAERCGDLGRRDLFEAAMRVGATEVGEGDGDIGLFEVKYRVASQRYDTSPGMESAIGLAVEAWATGRHDEARRMAHDALHRVTPEAPLTAEAMFGLGVIESGNDAAAAERYLAGASALFEARGEMAMAGHCQYRRAVALRRNGGASEALAALEAAAQAWRADPNPGRLALVALERAELDPARAREHLECALRVGGPGDGVDISVRFRLGRLLARQLEPAGRLFADALAGFRRLGFHDSAALCLAYLARHSAQSGDLPGAADQWFQGIDVVKGTGVRATDRCRDLTWLTLRAATTGDIPLAARALRVLASATSDDEFPDPDAEAALLDAAVRLVALRPPDEARELLEGAHGDLPRERRALIEPFVLAARCLTEPREAVLLEQPEEMRRVVDDVLARAARVSANPPVEPAWFTTGDVTAE